MDHYTRLLNNLPSLQTNINNLTHEIAQLIEKFNSRILTIVEKLDAIDLRKAPNRDEIGLLRAQVNSYAKELNYEFLKPLLYLQKQNFKLIVYLKQDILPFIASKTPEAQKIQEQIRPLDKTLHQNNAQIKICSATLKIFLAKTEHIQQAFDKYLSHQSLGTDSQQRESVPKMLWKFLLQLGKTKLSNATQMSNLQEAIIVMRRSFKA